jgi:mRNA interferase MazF
MPFDFGDIVLVPFPFSDQSANKRRPAAIVSSRAYHQARSDVVVMAVTSQLRAGDLFGDIPVRDWQKAGLLKPSAIKPVFATIHRSLVLRSLGALQAGDQAALRQALTTILG